MRDDEADDKEEEEEFRGADVIRAGRRRRRGGRGGGGGGVVGQDAVHVGGLEEVAAVGVDEDLPLFSGGHLGGLGFGRRASSPVRVGLEDCGSLGNNSAGVSPPFGGTGAGDFH